MRTQAEWQALIQGQQQSGTAFCNERGVNSKEGFICAVSPPPKISKEQLHWLLSGYDIIGHQPLYFSSTS